MLRAGVSVYAFDPSDVNAALTGGAVGVNLYHGVPLKVIENDVVVGTSGRIYHPRTRLDRFRTATVYYPRTLRNDFVLATSPEVATIMERSFGDRAGETLVARPPRLAAADITAATSGDGPSTLLYAPTWRPGPGWRLDEALPDIGALDAALAASDTRLLVKGHLYDEIEVLSSCDRLEIVPADTDITGVLGRVDGLITDYSSVAFDAAYVGIPVVFYPFDLDRYRAEASPRFNFDYEALVEGRSAHDFEDLLGVIRRGSWRGFSFSDEVRERVWGTDSSGSIEESNAELARRVLSTAHERFGSKR